MRTQRQMSPGTVGWDELTRIRQTWWVAYVVTVLTVAVCTVTLKLLSPFFPLAQFPIVYVLLTMGIAYLFGAEPAVASFLLSLFSLGYVAYPEHLSWPPEFTSHGLAALAALFAGTLIGGLAALAVRRSQRRIARLAQDLGQQRVLMETFSKHVPVGLTLMDSQMRYVIVNPAFAEMNKKSVEEMIGKTIWEVLPSEVVSDVEAAIRRVFDTRVPVMWHDFAVALDGERYLDVEYLPIVAAGATVGVGVVIVDMTEQVKTRRELEEHYDREHRIAEMLQAGLLGVVPQSFNGFEFETLYCAALKEASVGGDFYDVFPLNEGRIAIVVGDVSGKGLNAAVQVAMAKYSLRCWALECDSPAVVMEHVNRVVEHQLDAENFVTIFLGIVDTNSKMLTYANGGHAPVIFWEAAGSRASLIESTGPIVGIDSRSAYCEGRIHLQPEDELLICTDGVLEARCIPNPLETEDLLNIYTNMKRTESVSAAGFVERVLDYCDGGLRDDVAILKVSTVR